MTATGRLAVSRLVPVLPYHDPTAAVAWLSRAFGFETQSLVSGADGAFHYALLSFGGTAVMITEAPKDTGGGNAAPGADPSSCYFVVGDADAHYAAAQAQGVEIVFPLHDMDHGGRGYSCLDLEGRVWSFGTFDPCRGTAVSAEPPLEPVSQGPQAAPLRARTHYLGLLSGLGGVLLGSAVAAAWFSGGTPQDTPEVAVARILPQVDGERRDREAAEKAIADVRARLAQEQRARESAERASAEARAAADRERAAKEEAGRALTEARSRIAALEQEKVRAPAPRPAVRQQAKPEEQADRERAARLAAEAALEAANEQLAEERTAREAAEHASREAQGELERERNSKAQAWKIVNQLRRQIGQRAAAGSAPGNAPATADAPPAPKKNADPPYNGPLSPF